MANEKNKKDFNRLYISELATAAICGYLIYTMSNSPQTGLDLRLILPGGLLIIIILQNAGYWYYRHQLNTNPSGNFGWVLPAFSFLKRLNPLLMIFYPLFLVYLLIFNRNALWTPLNIFGIILYVFSILEYFNYYFFSLKHSNWKKKEPTELCLEIQEYNQNKQI